MNEFTKFSLLTAKFKRLRDFLIPVTVQEKMIRHVENIPGFQMKVIDKDTHHDSTSSIWVVPYPFVRPAQNILDTDDDYKLYSASMHGEVTKNKILNNRIGRYQNRFLPENRLEEFDNNDDKFSIVHVYSGDINIIDRSLSDMSKTVLYVIPERLPSLIRSIANAVHIQNAPDQEILDNAYTDYDPDKLDGADISSLVYNARVTNTAYYLNKAAEIILEDRYLLGIQVYGYDNEEDDQLLGTTPEAIHTKEQMDVITTHLMEKIKNKDKVILIV